MGNSLISKFPHKTVFKLYISYNMNPSLLISVVIAVASIHYAEAFFGADVVTGSGALFTGGGGTHVLLASGAGIGGAAAVVGGAILLKSLVLLGASRAGRGKRSVGEETNESIFTLLAASEPSSCIRQLICDIATGEKPSDYDVILSLFNEDVPASSPKFDFAVAAAVGKEVKSLEACELRYSCPLSSTDIFSALNN